MQEVCPQRKLADWTGVDSLLAPATSLFVLVVANLLLPDVKHWLLTPTRPFGQGGVDEVEIAKQSGFPASTTSSA